MAQDIWNRHALQWQKIGPPLRPCAEDIELMQRLVARACALVAPDAEHGSHAPNALLLGVTREIALMQWPQNTTLTAVDLNPAMIEHWWPGGQLKAARALVGDWTKMPLGDRCCDVVVGDGSFSTLSYPVEYDLLARQVCRVLNPGGSLVVRLYVRPDKPEPIGSLFEELFAGQIGSFHLFKWRLAMAVHGGIERGVRLGDIWDTWHQAVPNPEVLSRCLGWPLDTIETINAYRNSDIRYTFPCWAEYRRAWPGYFAEEECIVPGYESGERFPTVSLRIIGGHNERP